MTTFGSGKSVRSSKYIPYLYERVKAYINSLTLNSQIVASRETVQISTNSGGGDEDFSNSTVTFKVYHGGTDQTLNWTISVNSETNCTTSQTDNDISITAITSDEASYTVRADRSDYNTITKVIQVSKVKDGVAGVGLATVDNETMEVDGSGDLKVKNHTFYNDGTDFTNSLLIGFGALENTVSAENTNFLSINPDTGTYDITAVQNIINLGTNTYGRYLRAIAMTNAVVIGQDLFVRNLLSSAASDNFLMIGLKKNINYPNNIISDSVAIGIDPVNKLSNSTSLGLYKEDDSLFEDGNNEIYYTSKSTIVPNATATDIDLDLSALDTGGKEVLKITLDITGKVSTTDIYTEEVYLVIQNQTAVLDYSDINKQYDVGTYLNGISVTHSYASNTVTVSIPSIANSSYWIINYEIKCIG